MGKVRINPETGIIQKQSFGFFGSDWEDVSDRTAVRVDPDSGKVQKQVKGFFGSSWEDVDSNSQVRINQDSGEIESRSGLLNDWSDNLADLDFDDDD